MVNLRDPILRFGSSADIAHILSSYCLAGKYVFNLIGRILGFGFSAQIDRKNSELQGKGRNQKARRKLEKTSNQCFLD